jgi:hypothetical protein
MADYDSVSDCKSVVVLTPDSYDADNTPAAIDTLNWRSVAIETNVGIGGITFDATNKVEFTLTHSDDDATYTAVEATDVIMPYGETLGTGGIIRSLIAAKAAADTVAHQVGYIGKKRYLKVLANFSGTHGTATPMAINARFGDPVQGPYDQGNYDDSHSVSI